MLPSILKKVRLLDLKTKNKITSLFAGNYRSAFKGRGIEFADIRLYDMGDDVRDIDWKTSSKQGELYVKTYHEARDNNLFFLIDVSPALQFRSTEKFKYETLLETFAMLAFSAVQNGDRVGALIYGNGKLKIFPAKKRRKNILNIMAYCLEQYSAKNPAKKLIKKSEIFHLVQNFLKRSATIFWLTDDLELDKKSREKIKLLKYKHDFIPLIINDPVENNLQQTGHFILQNARTSELQSVFANKEVLENFRKIRFQKQKNFVDFFQKNRMDSLFITTIDKLFPKLLRFFQFRQMKG
jgi:uncharacterized protein (DUF58 family)